MDAKKHTELMQALQLREPCALLDAILEQHGLSTDQIAPRVAPVLDELARLAIDLVGQLDQRDAKKSRRELVLDVAEAQVEETQHREEASRAGMKHSECLRIVHESEEEHYRQSQRLAKVRERRAAAEILADVLEKVDAVFGHLANQPEHDGSPVIFDATVARHGLPTPGQVAELQALVEAQRVRRDGARLALTDAKLAHELAESRLERATLSVTTARRRLATAQPTTTPPSEMV